MKIIKVDSDKKQFLDLLLLGDEQEDMIDKYLDKGDLFALYDDDLKSVCVVTKENEDTCEIKNLATYPQYQKRGYAGKLLNYVFDFYKDKYSFVLVGTGNNSDTIKFYQNCGFSYSHTLKNFFTDNYDKPIFENGVQLVDMIYFNRKLSEKM